MKLKIYQAIKFNFKKSPKKNHEESNISEGKQSRGGIIQFNNLKNNYEKIENKYINKYNNYIVVE